MSICTILVQVLCNIFKIPLETVVTGAREEAQHQNKKDKLKHNSNVNQHI